VHPSGPIATQDPAKAQRPAPRPIVIEHFTPELLMPSSDAARRPETNTAQSPTAATRGSKASNFIASSAASAGVGSPELTPSEVAAALESESAPDQEQSVPRFLLPLAVGAILVLALVLVGWYVLRTHTNSTPAVVEIDQDPPMPTQADVTPATMAAEEPAAPSVESGSNTLGTSDAAAPALSEAQSTASAPTAPASDAAAPAEIHEEIPEIPPRIRESIRGHVRVAVRLIVDKEGSVFAALVDEPGPSRYFERLAIEAAKKWTFPPMDTTGSRLELVRFDFTRQGATGRAVEIE
jgi:TonB family protein